MVDVDATTGRRVAGALASRLVIYGLPLLLVVVAALDLNVWPATGWRLFSGVRQETQVTWIVDAVDESGGVRRYDPATAGPRRSTWRHSLDHSVDDPAHQESLCHDWLSEARASSPSIRQLRVRRAVVTVPRDEAGRAQVDWERVVVTCS
ncbi:MAG: hypothetical protein JJE52_01880 [Acidimicrobiia bacterium]|nr:hypothetical protein [Acidimicrobiia bacterium]